MDPQTAWDDLLAAYADGNWQLVDELADGLITWLTRGGFPPRATTGADLGQDWDRTVALAACRFAVEKASQGVGHVP